MSNPLYHAVAVLISTIACAAWPMTAYSTTLRSLSLEELVTSADAVLVGHTDGGDNATTAQSYWQDGRIYTRITLRIDEIWTGHSVLAPTSRADDAPRDIDIITLGGQVGAIGQKVHGAVTLDAPQRVVLCLRRAADRSYRVVGMAQGVFFVDGMASATKVHPGGDDAPNNAGGISLDPPVYRVIDHRVHWVASPQPGRSTPMPTTLHALRQAVLEIAHGNKH